MSKIELYNGDCLEVMKSIPDKSVDLVLTDPPYGIDFLSPRTDNHIKIKNDDLLTWTELLPLWLKQFERILTDTGCCCCCCGGGGKTPVSAMFTMEFVNYFNLIQTVIWDKKTIGLGWRYRPSYETIIIGSKSKDKYNWYSEKKDISNIIKINNIIPQNGDHPTPKPVKLMKYFLELHSTAGQTILDCFMGSGTTGVACVEMDRNFIGIELHKPYFDMAAQRIKDTQNQLRLF